MQSTKPQQITLLLLLVLICHTNWAQQWTPVPLITQTMKVQGYMGGEGCQVVLSIECDHTDGSFLLMGTDVGGIYRSIDGGKIWQPCNVGYSPRGNAGFAIDPNNNRRALAVGANSTKNQSHGLYLSTDQGASWKQVFIESNYVGYRSFADKVEFVKSSFDAVLGYSKTVYWSNPAGGIFKSADGGLSWTKVNSSYGNSILKVNPEKGDVYVANSTGLYKSVDGGLTFVKKSSEAVTDMDVVVTAVDKVFITTASKLLVSVDGGETFSQITSTTYPTKVASLNVSEANPDYMAVCNKINDWGGPIYYSSNGGTSWAVATRSNTHAFMPYNDRLQKFAWHPTDKNKVWALGGDWISSSTNAGKNFEWDANGYNGILVGGFFNFNITDPNLLYVGSQDYNGAFTKDDGQTWLYCNAANLTWGGFTYGAYAASDKVLVTQNSPGWGQDGKLTVSKNGGTSFVNLSLTCTGHDVGCGDPKDPNVIYFSNYYSKDLATTWKVMKGCTGVFTANLFGDQEVYGGDGYNVVKSTDKGDTWTVVKTLPNVVSDIAIDHSQYRLYIVISGDRLFQYDSGGLKELTSLIPKDQYNNIAIQTVAVDPQNPKVVYCAGAKNIYKSDASVKRSIDSGKTWQIITPNTRTNKGIELGDGANEVFAIRVNPQTRELWAAGSCYGIWKEAGIKSLSVTLTEPTKNGLYISGTDLTLKAQVTQLDNSISKVEFFNDKVKLGESVAAPYQYNWQNIPLGDFILHAKVTDALGDTVVSVLVPVSVVKSIAPEVVISSPENSSLFAGNSNILIKANASDRDGTIAKVEFYQGSTKIGESSESPYRFDWKNVSIGEYILTAKAIDNEGLATTSLPVPISVSGQDGLLDYKENFDDNLAQNWKSNSGTWVVESKQMHHTSTDGIDITVYEGTTFYNFTYSVKIKPEWGNYFGLVFNYVDNKNYYRLELGNDKSVKLIEVKNGGEKVLASATYTGGGQGVFSTLKITNNSKTTTVEINSKVVFNNVATTAFRYGKIGLYAWYQPIWYDDIEVNAESKGFPVGTQIMVENGKGINCFPNPLTDGNLTIQLAGSEKNIQLEIYNLAGQIVWSEKKTEASSFSLPSKVFPTDALYIVKVNSDTNFYQSKVLKLAN